MMERVMIQADRELLQRARKRARERGISLAQLAREALEKEVVADRPRPRSKLLGSINTGMGDLARRASEEYEPPPWRS